MQLPSALRVAMGAITVAVLFALAVVGTNLWRQGWWPFQPEIGPATVAAPPVTPHLARAYSGVAQVRGDASCTGWLLDTGTAEAPAYLVTGGRCAQGRRLPSTAVGLDLDTSGEVQFGLGTGLPYAVPITRVAYTTMKGTDISVLTLGLTLGDLQRRGITAYDPTQLPQFRRLVTNAAVPVQGLSASQVVLRAGRCSAGHRADLAEGRWLFDDVLAIDCPGVLEGSAGSPVFDRANRVVGMINTGTAGTGPGGECDLGKPCELTATGTTTATDRSYAVSVDQLPACFPDGAFAFTPQCPLPRQTVLVQPGSATVPAGAATIALQVSAATPTSVRTGAAPLSVADVCAAPETYQGTAAVGPGLSPVQVRLPADPGRYVVCLDEPATGPVRVLVERSTG